MPNRAFRAAGPIAGLSIIASAVLIVAAIAIGSTGQAVGLGTTGVPGPGGLVLLAAIAFGIGGFGVTGVLGPPPLDGRAARAGLFGIALGLAGIFISSAISATLSADPLESWPAVITLLGGLLVLAVGAVLAVVGLLITRGLPRRVALIFLGGLGLATIGGNVVLGLLMGGAIHDDARLPFIAAVAVLLVGGGSMVAAIAGIGWLAIVGDRGPKASAT